MGGVGRPRGLYSITMEVIMKLEYVLTVVLVLIVLAVVVGVVVPQAQAEIAQALAPLQEALQVIPTPVQ